MLAIIAGSAGHQVLAQFGLEADALRVTETPFGVSSPIGAGRLGDEDVVVLTRHGSRGYELSAPSVNYRANLWALKDRGVTEVIAWSGPGAIDDSLNIGQYVIPDDVVDETRRRPDTFYAGTGLGVIRHNPVFCPRLRAALQAASEGSEPPPRNGGIYVCTEGPRLETPAEIRKYRLLGGQMVGMTLCPEVFLARELEICYAAILYITNYAEGIKQAKLRPEKLFGGLASPEEEQAQQRAVQKLPSVLQRATVIRRRVSVECACQRAMERYRKSGQIGDDWRQWVKSDWRRPTS